MSQFEVKTFAENQKWLVAVLRREKSKKKVENVDPRYITDFKSIVAAQYTPLSTIDKAEKWTSAL